MTDPMRPHPQGLIGRWMDAQDDLSLLRQDPSADPEALAWAKLHADAMTAALNASTTNPESLPD